jgi:hypothetical protein
MPSSHFAGDAKSQEDVTACHLWQVLLALPATCQEFESSNE